MMRVYLDHYDEMHILQYKNKKTMRRKHEWPHQDVYKPSAIFFYAVMNYFSTEEGTKRISLHKIEFLSDLSRTAESLLKVITL